MHSPLELSILNDHYDVAKWINDVEDAFMFFDCTGREKYMALRRLLDGTAERFLRTIVVSTYNELKAELLSEFGKRYSMQEVLQLLCACA